MTRAFKVQDGWVFLVEQRAAVDPLTGDVTILFDDGQRTFPQKEGGGYGVHAGEDLEVRDSGAVVFTADDLSVYEFDADHGGLVEIAGHFGRRVRYGYAEVAGDQRLVSVESDDGIEFVIDRDGSTGDIAAVSYENGRDTIRYTYWYDAEGRLVRVSGPEGHTTDYTYNAAGKVATRTTRLGAVWSYDYNESGQITSLKVDEQILGSFRYIPVGEPPKVGFEKTEVTDAYGRIWMYAFDKSDHLVGARNPLGGEIRQTWSGSRMTSRTDELGRTTNYTNSSGGKPSLTQYADGFVEFSKKNLLGLKTAEGSYDPGLDDTMTTKFDYNDDRLVSKMRDADRNSRSYDYRDGLLDEETRRNSTTIRYSYDGAGRVTRSIDGTGASFNYEYDDVGNLVESEDAERNRTNYEYDLRSRRVMRETEDRAVTEWTYGGGSGPLSMIDGEGGRTLYAYDARGRLISKTDPAGASESWEYDAYGHVITHTDKLGGITRTTFNGLGLRESRSRPNGATQSWAYDVAGQLVSETGLDGYTWTHSYDVRGRRIATQDPLGNVRRWGYDGRGNLILETDELGNTTSYTHGRVSFAVRNGYPVQTTTDALGQITTSLYDEEGHLMGSVAPDGSTVLVSRDDEGRLSGVKNPLGETRRVTRDDNGNAEFLTNWNGYWSSFEYDRMNRVSELVDPIGFGNRYAFSYDLLGRVEELEDPSGGIVEFSYDDAGNMIGERDEVGTETESTFDAAGNRLTRTDGLGNTESWIYGSTRYGGKYLVESYTDELGATTVYQRDAAGRTVVSTDPNLHVWSYRYNAVNDIAEVTDPHGGRTVYGYDAARRLTSVSNPAGAVVRYGYDALGRLVSITDPVGGVTSGTFDVRGALVSVSWPDGSQTSWIRDVLGRPLSQANPDGTTTQYLSYDPVGNLLEVDTGMGLESYGYDRLNRVISANDEATGLSYKTLLAPEGHMLGIVDGLGELTQYGHDDADRLVELETDFRLVIDYIRDDLGRVSRAEDSEGNTSHYTYDARGALVELRHSGPSGDLADYQYEYDLAGNLVRVTETIEGEATVITFAYDALDRLVEETYDTAAELNATYTYDAAGNRLTRTRAGEVIDYFYDEADRLFAAGAAEFVYDGRGRLVERIEGGRTTAFSYGGAGQMASIVEPAGGVWSFDYTAGGVLRTIVDPAGDVRHLQNVQDIPVGEYDDQGRSLVTMVINPEQERIVATRSPAATTRAFYDGLGNLAVVAGTTGSVANYGYTGFGETRRLSGEQQAQHPLRFTGARLVQDLDLYLYRERAYLPEVGRFISSNPALELPHLVAHAVDLPTQGLVTSPSSFTAAEVSRSLLDVNVVRVQPELFNQYVFSLNNPAAFSSAVGVRRLERESIDENPWKWYLLAP